VSSPVELTAYEAGLTVSSTGEYTSPSRFDQVVAQRRSEPDAESVTSIFGRGNKKNNLYKTTICSIQSSPTHFAMSSEDE